MRRERDVATVGCATGVVGDLAVVRCVPLSCLHLAQMSYMPSSSMHDAQLHVGMGEEHALGSGIPLSCMGSGRSTIEVGGDSVAVIATNPSLTDESGLREIFWSEP